MSEQEDQTMAKLNHFMRMLLQAGCTPEFVIERGFTYAVQLQKEEAVMEEANRAVMSGVEGEEVADTCTAWMDQAAIWLVTATRDLHINPEAREEASRHEHRS